MTHDDPTPGSGEPSLADRDSTIAALRQRVVQQQATIDALVMAAERRLDQPVGDSAFARWEQNVALHQLVQDRTARIRAAERLLRSVLDSLQDRMCILSVDGHILGTNRVWDEATVPRSANSFQAATDLNLALGVLGFTAKDSGRIEAAVRDVAEGRSPHACVRASCTRDNDVRHVMVRVHRVEEHDEAKAVVSIVDLTSTVRSQQQIAELAQALELEKSTLSGVLASIPLLVYWKDTDLRYVGVNRAFLTMRGLSDQRDVLGRTEDELPIHDDLTDSLLSVESDVAVTRRARNDLHVPLTDPDGGHRDLVLTVLPRCPDRSPEKHSDDGVDGPGHHPAALPGEGSPPQVEAVLTPAFHGVLGVAADVTPVRQLERQLAQASRLQSIGQLAAGIAHEINTPIQFVSDNTAFVAETLSPLLDALGVLTDSVKALEPGRCDIEPATGHDQAALRRACQTIAELDTHTLCEELPNALAESIEGLHRIAEIVRAMKDYAHPGGASTPTDVNRAVQTVVRVCRHEWRHVAHLEFDLDPQLPLITCVEGELKQAILNIIVNAAQALGSSPPVSPAPAGRAEGRPATPAGLIRISTRHGQDWVEIAIADNGPGMDEATQQRIFDPFYTTKDVGEGSGQGLSIAYASIVTRHHGQLKVTSAPGHGATFTIILPRTTAPA